MPPGWKGKAHACWYAAQALRADTEWLCFLDADVRALRRLLRDMAGARGNTDPRFIVDYYRECARVGHALYVEPSRVHADMILRGDADFARLAPLVVATVHPLSILRESDPKQRRVAFNRFVRDLKAAARMLAPAGSTDSAP